MSCLYNEKKKREKRYLYIFTTLLVSVKLVSCIFLVPQGKFYTQATIKFCCIFDKVLDCLNVKRISWPCKEALKSYKDWMTSIWCDWFWACLLENILRNLNWVFIKNHYILQKGFGRKTYFSDNSVPWSQATEQFVINRGNSKHKDLEFIV